MLELLALLIFTFAGVLFGYIVGRKDQDRDGKVVIDEDVMLKYRSLTPNSKRYVNGIIVGRMAHDERTTYKERR